MYDLAMYLDLYVKNLFPSWTEVFTIAGKIIADLSTADPEFHDQLKYISKKNTKINPKDFVNVFIQNEGKKSGNYLIENLENNNTLAAKANKDLLGEPLIFIRKWIGEGFANILHGNALLYVWDQLFMSLWASTDIEFVAKSILYLLKSQFMKANDYDGMRRVFLEDACKLNTADIQSAYMHLKSGGREREVSAFNKRNNEMTSNRNGDVNQDADYNKYIKSKAYKKKNIFDPIAFKNFKMILFVPKQGVTLDFDPSRVALIMTLYYGDHKLSQKFSENISLVKDIKPSFQESRSYEIELPDTIIFDLTNFNSDISASGFNDIFVLITLKFKTAKYEDVFLGYCKVPIYRPQKVGSINTWEVTQGQVTRLLHPGVQPFNLNDIPDIPKSSFKDRLGPNSSILFDIYNPNTDEFLSRSFEYN